MSFFARMECLPTDRSPGMQELFHRPVNIVAGQRVINDVYHIQNVNAYGSGLRQWMAKFHV